MNMVHFICRKWPGFRHILIWYFRTRFFILVVPYSRIDIGRHKNAIFQFYFSVLFFGSLLKYAKYQITSTATYRIQSKINDSSIVRDWLEIEFEIQHLGLRIWRDFKQKSKQRCKIWKIWEIWGFALKDWANPIGRDNWRIFIWRGFRFCLVFLNRRNRRKKINCKKIEFWCA